MSHSKKPPIKIQAMQSYFLQEQLLETWRWKRMGQDVLGHKTELPKCVWALLKKLI